MVQERRFREDLYYRLNVFTLHMPPLRERKEDIPLLVDYFLQNLPNKIEISSVALQMLMVFSWPGNIRELKNIIESAAVIAENGYIEPAQLPAKITGQFNNNSGANEISLPVNLCPDQSHRTFGDQSAQSLAPHQKTRYRCKKHQKQRNLMS
jgi:DNA-binding NtrC family response regulator